MAAMAMRYYPVGSLFQGLTDWIYVLRTDVPHARHVTGALLPQAMWHLSGTTRWRFGNGDVRPTYRAMLSGPSGAAMTLELDGPAVIAGLGIFPEGWSRLVGEPAHRMTGGTDDLTGAWGADALPPFSADPDDDLAIVHAIRRVLETRYIRAAARDDPRVSLIANWANDAAHSVDRLSAKLDISHRHLDRLALAHFGVGPKLLANKQRALGLATRMVLAPGKAAPLWADHYADQSHFIRNFRRFVGVTPGVFQDEATFVRSVFSARFAIKSEHPLGLNVAGG